MQLEARPYGPESTPEEIAAIEACVFVHEPGILYWRELPVQSHFQLQIFNRRLQELSAELERYRLIIDLVGARAPNAAARASLGEVFSDQPKLERAAVFNGRNFMLGIAAKFVLTRAGLRDFTVYKTLEEALEGLRDAPDT